MPSVSFQPGTPGASPTLTLPNFDPGCKLGLEKTVTSAHAFTGSFHDDEKSQKTVS